MRLAQFVTLLLYSLVAAVFWGTWLGLSRIDRQIHSWTAETLPPEWEATRDRWEFYHVTRTMASVVGLACLFGSVLTTRPVSDAR